MYLVLGKKDIKAHFQKNVWESEMGHQGTMQKAFIPAKGCSSEIRVGIFGYVCKFFNYDCALERTSSRIESLQRI